MEIYVFRHSESCIICYYKIVVYVLSTGNLNFASERFAVLGFNLACNPLGRRKSLSIYAAHCIFLPENLKIFLHVTPQRRSFDKKKILYTIYHYYTLFFLSNSYRLYGYMLDYSAQNQIYFTLFANLL